MVQGPQGASDLIAAAIPVAAGLDAPTWLIGGGGALIVALESLQQLRQYQQNWTSYQSTSQRLKHEKFLLARAGAATAERPSSRPGRVEGLVSQEQAAWVSMRGAVEADGESR